MKVPSLARSTVLLTMLGFAPGIVSYASAVCSEDRTPDITAAELRAHVEFLASDELEGRSIGSQGIEQAAHYLAAEFKSMGLEPAGDEGSFLQAMVFEREEYEALPQMSVTPVEGERRELVYGADFRLARSGAEGTFEVLVIHKDDPLPSEGDPRTALVFPDLSRGRVSRRLREEGHASGQGFGAVVTFLRRAGEATTQIPRSSRMALKKEADAAPAALWVELSPELREDVGNGDTLHVTPHLLPAEVTSYNIIARLPGRGSEARPELAEQAIVVSAHYDHIGLVSESRIPEDAGPDFDKVFNGADDDASGVATVLEIAAALAARGPQAREVIFLIATAEEIGIIGTSYYLDHPSTPLERTVANLNFEMVGRPDEKVGGAGRLWLSGAERTNLMAAYAEHNFKIGADPYPEQNFFQRSDNIVFCYRGIVGQTFSTYNLHSDYHKVSDDADSLDYEHMQSCAQAGLHAVELVADGSIDPEWLEGGQPKPR